MGDEEAGVTASLPAAWPAHRLLAHTRGRLPGPLVAESQGALGAYGAYGAFAALGGLTDHCCRYSAR